MSNKTSLKKEINTVNQSTHAVYQGSSKNYSAQKVQLSNKSAKELKIKRVKHLSTLATSGGKATSYNELISCFLQKYEHSSPAKYHTSGNEESYSKSL